MKVVRTEKEFSPENMTEDFVRRAVSLGGLHGCPLKKEWSDFSMEEHHKGISKTIGVAATVTPWREEHSDKYDKTQDGMTLKLSGFDTDVRIWPNGKIQGYYKESLNNQYAANPVEWVNLLLEYKFLEIKE